MQSVDATPLDPPSTPRTDGPDYPDGWEGRRGRGAEAGEADRSPCGGAYSVGAFWSSSEWIEGMSCFWWMTARILTFFAMT